MDHQQTLAKPATLAGTSLHTGGAVTLTMKPAPAGHGFKFRRMDLEDQPFISASVDKVQKVERATTLAEGSVKVHTVEHVLSALTGMGVDNAIIEMDANEPPIGDGSAQPFVEMHQERRHREAGGAAQRLRGPRAHPPRDRATAPCSPSCRTRSSASPAPTSGPDGRVHAVFLHGDHSGDLRKGNRPRAHLRLLRGHEAPAGEGPHQGRHAGKRRRHPRRHRHEPSEPLRFKDEFVRHKILDIIGDLMLFGRRIIGHVIAVKPGHGPNTEMARRLQAELQRACAAWCPPAVNIPTGEGRARHQRGDADPAAPLSVPDGGPHRRLRGREQVHRREERHHQRALLPGPLPRPPGHARRAPARGHGPGRQHPACSAARRIRARSATS